MFRTSFNKRPIIENSQTISVVNFIRYILIKADDKTIKTEERAQKIADLINEGSLTVNMKQEIAGKIDVSEENKVKVTYSRSNLGKGFVFWFVCNICGRKTRYLYFPAYSEVLACRQCHRLSYKRQNEPKSYRAFDKAFR